MRSSRALLFLFVLCLCSASLAQTAATACTVKPEDTQRIAETLRGMYKDAMAGDTAGVKAAFTEDGYLFDNGSRFTPESIMALMAKIKSQGTAYVWSVTEPDVHLDCTTGWIAFVNKGSVQNAAGTRDLQWLESADLIKKDGVWRIQFFQSSPVQSASK